MRLEAPGSAGMSRAGVAAFARAVTTLTLTAGDGTWV
jgi:hypothetical protein